MHILILEDEAIIAGRIERICRQYFGERLVTLYRLDEVDDALDYLSRHTVDLVLLDLNLNGHSGFRLLASASAAAHFTIIVSAHADQAIRAFEYAVLDFVAKPFSGQRLEQALMRIDDVKWRSDRSLARVAVRGAQGLHLVALSDVLYIRAAGHYCELVMSDGQVRLHDKNIDRLTSLLPGNFERIHRSYLLPLERIGSLLSEAGGKYGVRLHDGTVLPVGRSRYQALKARWDGVQR
jgi:DNA-binding LytR/AlgR family response regulator